MIYMHMLFLLGEFSKMQASSFGPKGNLGFDFEQLGVHVESSKRSSVLCFIQRDSLLGLPLHSRGSSSFVLPTRSVLSLFPTWVKPISIKARAAGFFFLLILVHNPCLFFLCCRFLTLIVLMC